MTLLKKEVFESINESMANASGVENVADFSVDVPDINVESANIEISMPAPESVNSSFEVPILPPNSEPTPLPSTTVEIPLGIDSSKVASITVDGTITVSFGIPDAWGDSVEISSFDIKVYSILSSDSSILIYQNTFSDIENNKVDIKLNDTDIKIGEEGKLALVYSLSIKNNSGGYLSGGNITLSITPEFSVKAFEDAVVDMEKGIALPSNVKDILLKGGSVKISSAKLKFTDVDGYIVYGEDERKNVEVDEDGALKVDLNGITLPATIELGKVSASFEGDSSGDIPLDISLSDPEASVVVYIDQDLSYSGSQTISLPSDFNIKEVSFVSGYINMEYDSSLPVDVNVKLWSPQLRKDDGSEWTKEIVISRGSELKEVLDFSGVKLVPDGTQIFIYYSASPTGYDPTEGTLEIPDISIGSGEILSFEATVSYGNISIGHIEITDFSTKIEDDIDIPEMLGGNYGNFKNALSAAIQMLSTMDIDGTLTINMDVNGSIDGTLTSYDEDEALLSTTEVKVDMEDGVANLKPLFEGIKDILRSGTPTVIEYDLNVNMDSFSIDLSDATDVTVGLDLEAPMEFSIGTPARIYYVKDSIPASELSIPDNATLTEATLLIEGTNTTGINLEIDVTINEKVYKVNAMGSKVDGSVKLSAEDIEKMKKDGLPYEVEVWLPKGDYTLSSDGELDIKMKIAADVVVGTK